MRLEDEEQQLQQEVVSVEELLMQSEVEERFRKEQQHIAEDDCEYESRANDNTTACHQMQNNLMTLLDQS